MNISKLVHRVFPRTTINIFLIILHETPYTPLKVLFPTERHLQKNAKFVDPSKNPWLLTNQPAPYENKVLTTSEQKKQIILFSNTYVHFVTVS